MFSLLVAVCLLVLVWLFSLFIAIHIYLYTLQNPNWNKFNELNRKEREGTRKKRKIFMVLLLPVFNQKFNRFRFLWAGKEWNFQSDRHQWFMNERPCGLHCNGYTLPYEMVIKRGYTLLCFFLSLLINIQISAHFFSPQVYVYPLNCG